MHLKREVSAPVQNSSTQLHIAMLTDKLLAVLASKETLELIENLSHGVINSPPEARSKFLLSVGIYVTEDSSGGTS